MEKWENTVWNNQTGLPVANPTVTVYHVGTLVTATIYADEGVTTKANPFTGDAQGRVHFYAPDGVYDVKIEGSGITAYTLLAVMLGDVRHGGQSLVEGIDVQVALANAVYNRQTAAWNRVSTSRPAWRVEADSTGANDYLRIHRAPAAANPITWAELLRLTGAGHLALGLADPTVGTNYQLNAVLAALAGASRPGLKLIGRRTADGDVGALDLMNNPSGATYHVLARILAQRSGADNTGYLSFQTMNAGTLTERLRVENAFQLRLRQATADLIVAWSNPGAARTLTIPDPGGNDSFVFLAASQVLSNKAGVPFDTVGATGSADLATTGTEYLSIVGILGPDATEANREVIVWQAGQLIGLRVRLDTAPGASTSHVFTLRINGADTGIVVTIADSATTGSATGTVSVAAGDRVSLKHTVTGTPAAAKAQYATRRRETAVA